MSDLSASPIVVGVDIGGTFTDFLVADESGVRVHKILSTPDDPSRAVLQGLRDLGVPPGSAGVHGSTVATNALLERKGARTALVTTKGFTDIIEIGRQNRPRLYDLAPTKPPPLAPAELRFGADERVTADGRILQPLTDEEATAIAQRVKASGAEAVAVCLLFSFLQPGHEERIAQALEAAGVGPYVYLSSEVLPEYREYERMSTTVISAYIAPVVHSYLSRLQSEIGQGLRVMQTSGGSVTGPAAMKQPVQTISGGPAGGVVGAFHVARLAGYDRIICLDMGGTSTDVCLCDGEIPATASWSLGDLPIKTPAIDVYSIGAGGGSIARVDAGGALQVGPESAGAVPGPACYGAGTQPTVTDANLVLGRITPGGFQVGGKPLAVSRAEDALRSISQAMRSDVYHAAAGVLAVANANMERAIRVTSVERGHDPRDFTLVAFGGAGPLHACDLALSLGIPRVLIPRHAGVLSALGMTHAEVRQEHAATVMLREDPLDMAAAAAALARLDAQGRSELQAMGVPRDQLTVRHSLDMRYIGQSFEITIAYDGETADGAIASFHKAHLAQYGYAHESRAAEIVNVRTRVSGPAPAREEPASEPAGPDSRHARVGTQRIWLSEQATEAAIYDRDLLHVGNEITGPAIVQQYDCTVMVLPGWLATVDRHLNLLLEQVSS